MATDVLSVSGASSGLTGRPYDHPQRSKARPKHSLFGAEIQHLDDDEKQEMKSIDLENFQQEEKRVRFARQSRYKSSLPDYLKKSIYDGNINETKRELEERINNANRAKKMLSNLEEKSKYYLVGASVTPGSMSGPPRAGQWMTEEDLKNADKMNNVGVSADRPGYNRDKYQQQPLSHQYSLIGNPMKMGMDFPIEAMEPTYNNRPPFKRHKAPDWLPKEAFMNQTQPQADPGIVVDLPLNIQHQFGTNICRNLLGDKNKVHDTLERQRLIHEAFMKKKQEQKSPAKFPEPLNPEYESLSQSVRQNMFPGYTINNQKSHMTENYTRSVFDRRVPDPDQYRNQRDELSTWAEHNVMRDRVSKAWDNAKGDGEKK